MLGRLSSQAAVLIKETWMPVSDAILFLHKWALFQWAHFCCLWQNKSVDICYRFLSWIYFSYLGPNIWLEYGQYSVGGIGQKGGFEKVRSVFERALSSVGLHMTKGLAIWEAYREFESAIVEAARVSAHTWLHQQSSLVVLEERT